MLDNNKLESIKPLFSTAKEYARPEDYMSIRSRRYGVSYTGKKIKTFDDLTELDDYIHTNPMLI